MVESLVAVGVGADEWFLSSVDSHVNLEVTFFCESFVTNMTLDRFLACVSSLMDLKPSRSCVCFVAYLTDIGFFSCMN